MTHRAPITEAVEFKCPGVLFTSNGKMECEMARKIDTIAAFSVDRRVMNRDLLMYIGQHPSPHLPPNKICLIFNAFQRILSVK